MKIVSYNINSGKGADQICRPEESMKVLEKENAAVIALQEVASFRPECPPVDYLIEAEKYLKKNTAFGKTLNFENGGEYGNGILSEYPMQIMEVFPLDFPADAEPRAALIVKILAEKPFYMISLHLSYQGEFEGDDARRALALEKLENYVQEKGYFPVIAAGDFNNAPHSEAISFMRKNWNIANDAQKGAYTPTAKCGKGGWMQIDYIMSYPKGAFQHKGFAVIDSFGQSDHYPICAELELV